jgi:hypothetical protein
MGDRRASEGKEDLKKFKEEIVHQFHVISEDVISQVKQVAEGVANVDEKLDRGFNELKAEIQETKRCWQLSNSPMRNWTNGLQPSKKNSSNLNTVWKK